MNRRAAISMLAPLLLAACAGTSTRSDDPAARSTADIERDRQAILAMRGEYEVDFAFDETVVLKRGYERAPSMRSGGNETVIEVENTPTRIVLQHILVDGKTGHVTKHWRQDWEYEAPRRFEFSADQTWTLREIPAELTRGAWTQCVYEVSDAPRYCSTGRWVYEDGIATWAGDPTPRPLPRREYTRRKDYNVVMAINRHSIVPGGWTHEQDNTKLLRGADGAQAPLVREFGFNDYIRINSGRIDGGKVGGFDFSSAYRYWGKTRDYWTRVRGEWAARMAAGQGLHLKTRIDGMQLIIPLFGLAEQTEKGQVIADADIRKVLDRWVKPTSVIEQEIAASR